jgi:hypothetical protein
MLEGTRARVDCALELVVIEVEHAEAAVLGACDSHWLREGAGGWLDTVFLCHSNADDAKEALLAVSVLGESVAAPVVVRAANGRRDQDLIDSSSEPVRMVPG